MNATFAPNSLLIDWGYGLTLINLTSGIQSQPVTYNSQCGGQTGVKGYMDWAIAIPGNCATFIRVTKCPPQSPVGNLFLVQLCDGGIEPATLKGVVPNGSAQIVG